MDLADISGYLKATIVPEMPDDFIVAQPFRRGLSMAEIRGGMAAFRAFICALYDALAAGKDKIDAETGGDFDPDSVDGLTHVCYEGSLHKCFPIINDLAVLLFNLGLRGRLETQPEYALILSEGDLERPLDHKNEKYNSFIGMPDARKAELFRILAEMGLGIETMAVKCPGNPLLPVGLKLLAEAQMIRKTAYYPLKVVFMRGDFYPLGEKKVRMKDLNFNLFLAPHPPEIRAWITRIDKLLEDNGCSAKGEINNFNSNIVFTYTSRITGKDVCKIHMGIEGCKAYPYGRHLNGEENILKSLPESMQGCLLDGKHQCTGCATKRPDLVEHNVRYTLDGKAYRRCWNKGFGYPLNGADERGAIEKWIIMELAWS